MRRPTTISGLLAAALLMAACGDSTDQADPAPDATAPATHGAAAPTAEPTPEPTEEPTPEPPPQGVTYTGEGSQLVMLEEEDPGENWVLYGEHSGGDDQFMVTGVDDQGNETGSIILGGPDYTGHALMGRPPAALQVSASGPWTLTTKHVDTMPTWDGTQPYTGNGDQVFWVADGVAEGLTPVTATWEGEFNFVVMAYTAGSQQMIAMEYGAPGSGEYALPDGTTFITVEADNNAGWSIASGR